MWLDSKRDNYECFFHSRIRCCYFFYRKQACRCCLPCLITFSLTVSTFNEAETALLKAERISGEFCVAGIVSDPECDRLDVTLYLAIARCADEATDVCCSSTRRITIVSLSLSVCVWILRHLIESVTHVPLSSKVSDTPQT